MLCVAVEGQIFGTDIYGGAKLQSETLSLLMKENKVVSDVDW